MTTAGFCCACAGSCCHTGPCSYCERHGAPVVTVTPAPAQTVFFNVQCPECVRLVKTARWQTEEIASLRAEVERLRAEGLAACEALAARSTALRNLLEWVEEDVCEPDCQCTRCEAITRAKEVLK